MASRRKNPPTFRVGCLGMENAAELLDIGRMHKVCQHCQALLWDLESSSLCCSGGAVKLRPLSPFPKFLMDLWKDKDFMRNIRSYNSSLSFTSLGYTPDKTLTKNGVFTFRIQGTMYHKIGKKETPLFL